METEEMKWQEVILSGPAMAPHLKKEEEKEEGHELERESGERRRGRDVLVAVDHGTGSKHAFDWAVVHFCRLADTLHLVHVVTDINNEILVESARTMMEKLAKEAAEVAMVQTRGMILEGDIAKAICREAERIRPAALVMGTRGLGIVKSLFYGSVSEYCYRHCICPVVIVPSKEAGDVSVI